MTDAQRKKRMYLAIGMGVVGIGLLVTLNSFRSDSEKNPSEAVEENADVDFNIKLDTLDNKDRRLFYQREKDSVMPLNPYDKDKKSPDSDLLENLRELENVDKTPPEQVTSANNDGLWDLGDDGGDMENLKLDGEPEMDEMGRRQAERERLLEANRAKRALYGAGTTDGQKADPAGISFRAAVYQDQFVLPGDEVELILTEDASHNGKILPKNTIVYALASIDKNRVLLEATNINHVPMDLHVTDLADGMAGIRSQRAGELWAESSGQLQTDAYRDITAEASQESGRIARGVMRSLGDFFRKRKLGKKDKILLVNDHQIILTNGE